MSAAAVMAAIIQASRASGVIVSVQPREFLDLVQKQDEPLVVHSIRGVFTTNYQYLMSYKGLAFFTSSKSELRLPSDATMVYAQKIWIPSM